MTYLGKGVGGKDKNQNCSAGFLTTAFRHLGLRNSFLFSLILSFWGGAGGGNRSRKTN